MFEKHRLIIWPRHLAQTMSVKLLKFVLQAMFDRSVKSQNIALETKTREAFCAMFFAVQKFLFA